MFGDVFELVLQVVEPASDLSRIRPVPGGAPREHVGHIHGRLRLPRREHQPPACPRIANGFARDLQRGVGVVERVQGGGEIGAHARISPERCRRAEQRHLPPPARLRRRRRTASLHHEIITHGSQGSAGDAAGILACMNRLVYEPSLYLRQHADNPVDWYPWGAEALARATAEDKPLLISIGYSSCHWCHVMAHESFEDPAVAAVMNEHFVCIKVDREERPDLDALYMQATLLLARQGGWPMTVFATPDGRPYFAGTYFPPTSRGSMPGFAELCVWMASVYRERGADVEAQAAELVGHMERIAARRGAETGISAATVVTAVAELAARFDHAQGGFGGAPKFPPSTVLEFLLGVDGLPEIAGAAQEMAEITLRRMADGGIRDQIGGGFHRYATDDIWLVPHFEKMLYDNALLARVYVRAAHRSHDPRWRDGRRTDARFPGAGDAAARRRLRGRPGRRLARRRGRILRLDTGRDRRAPAARPGPRGQAPLRRQRAGQLRRPHDPACGAATPDARG